MLLGSIHTSPLHDSTCVVPVVRDVCPLFYRIFSFFSLGGIFLRHAQPDYICFYSQLFSYLRTFLHKHSRWVAGRGVGSFQPVDRYLRDVSTAGILRGWKVFPNLASTTTTETAKLNKECLKLNNAQVCISTSQTIRPSVGPEQQPWEVLERGTANVIHSSECDVSFRISPKTVTPKLLSRCVSTTSIY